MAQKFTISIRFHVSFTPTILLSISNPNDVDEFVLFYILRFYPVTQIDFYTNLLTVGFMENERRTVKLMVRVCGEVSSKRKGRSLSFN